MANGDKTQAATKTAEGEVPKDDSPKDTKERKTQAATKTVVCHVVGPGSLFYGGKLRAAGEEIEVSSDDLQAMGDLVRPGTAPKPPAPIADRAEGRYVVGPGSVWCGGKMLPSGTELTLSASEARSLGDAVAEKR